MLGELGKGTFLITLSVKTLSFYFQQSQIMSIYVLEDSGLLFSKVISETTVSSLRKRDSVTKVWFSIHSKC